MKEKTRKTLAIVLLGIGVFVPLVMNYVPIRWFIWNLGMSDGDIGMVYALRNYSSLFISGCFLFAGIWALKRLLNAVTRRFFYRLFIGLFICEVIGCVIMGLLGLAEISGVQWIWQLISLAKVIILMSGAGIISRNYTLNAYLALKLRLFQTGIVLRLSGFAFNIIYNLYWKVPDHVIVDISLDHEIKIALQLSSQLIPVINFIYAIGLVCLFLGLVGIIRSDLLSEERRAEVFGKIGGGWFSRPVIGGVCFNVFLLIVIVSSVTVLGNL